MWQRLQRLRNDQAGMSLVFVGVGLTAFVSATILAVDVGMVMTARSQAQNAADAGALAGAISLVYDDFQDRTASGPAVQSAVLAAQGNTVMGQVVSVTPADVTFPLSPSGQSTQVRVWVYRTNGRSNGVTNLVAAYFGMPTTDVSATATAEVSPANAMTCVKPFTIPDKWIELQTPPWDPSDTFDMVDHQGNPLASPDVYIPTSPTQVGTGYDPFADRGTQLVIKAGTGGNIEPGFYFPLALPGSGGGSDYGTNISACNSTILHSGDAMTPEPGNMTGPTAAGIAELIALDPGAYWDAGENRLVSSMHPSPRVAVIPLFDPAFYDTGKQEGRTADLRAANFLGFFIEEMQGNNVVGRITPVGGIVDGSGPVPLGAFPRSTRLVQ
jgi:hypothetical protein